LIIFLGSVAMYRSNLADGDFTFCSHFSPTHPVEQ
jgi:hypothetical protein